MLPPEEKQTNVPEKEICVAADDPSGIQAEGTRQGCSWGINVSRGQGWQCTSSFCLLPGRGCACHVPSALRDSSRGGRTNSKKGALHLGNSITESITGIKQKAITNPNFCHWWGHRVWATEGRDISARGLRCHEDILSFWVDRCDGVYSKLRIHYKGFP